MPYALMTEAGFAVHRDDDTIEEIIAAPFTVLIRASQPPSTVEIETPRARRKMEFRLPRTQIDFAGTFIPPSILKNAEAVLPNIEGRHTAMIRRIGITPKRRDRIERFLREMNAGAPKPDSSSTDYQALRIMLAECAAFRKYVAEGHPRWLIRSYGSVR